MMDTQGRKENMLGEHRASGLRVQYLGITYFQFGKGAGVGELNQEKEEQGSGKSISSRRHKLKAPLSK